VEYIGKNNVKLRNYIMNLIFDAEGKVNYDKINKNTTAKDVLDAVDVFLNNNPLDCNGCEESCCKKAWSVEMDNICVNKISNWNDEVALEFVQEKLVKKRNYCRDFDQYVLNKKTNCNFITETNLCTIYEDKIRNNNFTNEKLNKYKRNPAVFAKEYNILLEDIFDYAEYEGWIDIDEREELYTEIILKP